MDYSNIFYSFQKYIWENVCKEAITCPMFSSTGLRDRRKTVPKSNPSFAKYAAMFLVTAYDEFDDPMRYSRQTELSAEDEISARITANQIAEQFRGGISCRQVDIVDIVRVI